MTRETKKERNNGSTKQQQTATTNSNSIVQLIHKKIWYSKEKI